jgi:hypothetical protein
MESECERFDVNVRALFVALLLSGSFMIWGGWYIAHSVFHPR